MPIRETRPAKEICNLGNESSMASCFLLEMPFFVVVSNADMCLQPNWKKFHELMMQEFSQSLCQSLSICEASSEAVRSHFAEIQNVRVHILKGGGIIWRQRRLSQHSVSLTTGAPLLAPPSSVLGCQV